MVCQLTVCAGKKLALKIALLECSKKTGDIHIFTAISYPEQLAQRFNFTDGRCTKGHQNHNKASKKGLGSSLIFTVHFPQISNPFGKGLVFSRFSIFSTLAVHFLKSLQCISAFLNNTPLAAAHICRAICLGAPLLKLYYIRKK